MKAKITDVAQKANVSISTVSHVLNHTRFVSEETRKKVMDAVEELGYSPDASGRTFRTGKKMMIGLVVPDITNSVFAALIEDVDDVISKQGYNLVISNTRDCLKMEKQALRNLAFGGRRWDCNCFYIRRFSDNKEADTGQIPNDIYGSGAPGQKL
mgnify:FL=1